MRGSSFDEVRSRLERELEARGGNMRQLARDAAVDGTNPETVRRTLYRIFDGTVPEQETSAALERGLGKKAGYFTVDQERAARDRQDRLTALEGEVADLKHALHLAGLAHDELLKRVAALEAKPRRTAAPPAAESTRRGPRTR